MQYVVLDFETFWSQEYTLSKLPLAVYVRDPQFLAHGVAVKIGDGPAFWVNTGLREFLHAIDWSQVILVGHNLAFDGLILSHHYGVTPAMYLDTLGMSRGVFGTSIRRHALTAVGEHMGFGGKLGEGSILARTRGKRILSPAEDAEMGAYAIRDADLAWNVAKTLLNGFPPQELSLLDTSIRCVTQPCVYLDVPALEAAHRTEVAEKAAALGKLQLERVDVNSNERLAALLRAERVEPPMKESKKTGKETYAFSKSDEEFVNLQLHPNPRVRALVETRLRVKSSIFETRTQAFASVGRTGLVPIELNYAGAMTTQRFSGAGCLPADAAVFVLRDEQVLELPIVDVQSQDLVWDGLEFVAHDGVVYSGTREVIEHDGARATCEHVVFTEAGEMPLQDAKRRGVQLVRPALPEASAGAQGREVPLHEPSKHRVAELRPAGGGVPVRVPSSSSDLVCNEPGLSAPWGNARPGGQQRALRAGELALGNTFDPSEEQTPLQAEAGRRARPNAAGAREPVLLRDASHVHQTGDVGHGDTCTKENDERAPPRLGAVERTAARPVYDILNCGPRHRFVADRRLVHNSLNFQNLPRHRKGKRSVLRDAIVAPAGWKFVTSDLSQIELRIAACLAGETIILDALRRKDCVYSQFASGLFGVPVSKALAKVDEKVAEHRQIGKVSVLQCQYASGAGALRKALWVQTEGKLVMTPDEARQTVRTYRRTYQKFPEFWRLLDKQIECWFFTDPKLAAARAAASSTYADNYVRGLGSNSFDLLQKPFLNVDYGRITGPHGLALKYPDIQYDKDTTSYTYASFAKTATEGRVGIYGGKLFENLCQWLARVVMTDAMLELRNYYKIVMTVHDELVLLVPDALVEQAKRHVSHVMSQSPSWWPELPVECEVGVGQRYGDAK